jgi:hypothetical protein
MKLQDLISNLAGKSYVKQLEELEPKQLATENANLYDQHYFEVKDGVVRETKLPIIVFNEGTTEEEAFPYNKTATDTHYLEEKYQTQIKSVHGKVVNKGSDWIVVDGYATKEVTQSDGSIKVVMENKRWFAEEISGKLDIKEVY